MACGSACCASPKATSVVMRSLPLPVLNTDAGSSATPCKEEKSCQPELNTMADNPKTLTLPTAARENSLLAVTLPVLTDLRSARVLLRSTRQAVHLQIAPAEMAERRVNDMLAAPGINISPDWKRLAAFVVHYSL
ncbi:hypothetical protein SNOG_06155 [Parastagonospora nodorum SN15]|uniref:Uncharacterized protein n=1 Tax=Phaeosphaeria nodorum (strain SN15 / ATCC MYA-4574 / FGSC 10173) TaxID=321614 RepID=Q0UQ09_PHANO|nr:hypothetical protein SNOG_06155 [Parastagonospora nodorum SN15]EAT85986.1 hypothetical protein SNOG_06155 [Parastagonospora nodorum SN15]